MSGVTVASAQVPPPADTPITTTDPGPPPPPPSTAAPTVTAAPAPAYQATAPASSDDTIGSAVGVGVHAMLTGPVGPSIVYNGGRFHIEGILSFADIEEQTTIGVAGRAWFHLHESNGASLSVGGGAGMASQEVTNPLNPMDSDTQTDILLEGGAQIRFFATRNVALSASLGLGIIAGDGDGIAILGQLSGGLGVTYFIF